MAQWCVKMAEIGYGRTKEELKDTVKKILDRDGRYVPEFKDNRPGKDWYYLFLRRHPELTERKPESLQISRAMACSEEKVLKWFNDFEAFIRENGIKSPSQIANVDETGCPFQAGSSGKIIVEKGISNAYQISSPSKEQITTLVCGFANGTVLPPYHLYPGQRLNAQWTQDAVPDSYFGVTAKGWMETEAFYAWIANRFVKQGPAIRPIVLLLDGHESHIDMYISKFCAENQILLYCLPPHCSHIMQPLDVGFFHPLKSQWRKACKEFTEKNPGVTVNKMNFSRVFRDAWQKTVTFEGMVSSFAKAGIWPVYSSRSNKKAFAPATAYMRGPQEGKENIPLPAKVKEADEPTPPIQKRDHRPHLTALQSLEKALSEDQLVKFRRRLHEGYDLEMDDPLYKVWKSLITTELSSNPGTSKDIEVPNARRQLAFRVESSREITPHDKETKRAKETATALAPAFSELLVYPGIVKKKERKRAVKHCLPRHLTSHEAIHLMQEENKRKKKEEDEKQRRKEERERKREEKENAKKIEKEKKEESQRKHQDGFGNARSVESQMTMKKSQMTGLDATTVHTGFTLNVLV